MDILLCALVFIGCALFVKWFEKPFLKSYEEARNRKVEQ